MYISGYNEIVDELLTKIDDKSDGAPARGLEERVGGILKQAADDAYDSVLDVVRDCLLSNLEDAIRDSARRLAEQYVQSALAGDEKTFGDMFDFRHNWKEGAYFHTERLPIGVKLRRLLLNRHRTLFENQIIDDLEGELTALKRYHKLYGWRTMVEGDL